MNTQYIATFMVGPEQRSTVLPNGISQAKEGFWIDSNLQYACCNLSLWIPPCQVLFVKRVEG